MLVAVSGVPGSERDLDIVKKVAALLTYCPHWKSYDVKIIQEEFGNDGVFGLYSLRFASSVKAIV